MKKYFWVLICIIFIAMVGVTNFYLNNTDKKIEGADTKAKDIEASETIQSPLVVSPITPTQTPAKTPAKTSQPAQPKRITLPPPSTVQYKNTMPEVKAPVINIIPQPKIEPIKRKVCKKTGWGTFYDPIWIDYYPTPYGYYDCSNTNL